MPLIGSNVKVEVQNAMGTATTITGITNASEAVISTATTPVVGDVVVLSLSGGMTDVDKQAVRVKTVNAGVSFVAEGLDTTGSGAFSSGTFKKVTGWDQFGKATSISVDAQSAQENPVTTLLDTQEKIVYGNLSATKGSFGALFEPSDVASINLRAATKTKSERTFRVTFSDGQKAIWNSLVAMGDSFQMETGGVGKSTCGFTLMGRQIMYYAT